MLINVCMGGNLNTISLVNDIGLNVEHILLMIHPDEEKLVIHEKFKQVYMKLCKVLFIENDSYSSQIHTKNRMYIWQKCKRNPDEEEMQNVNEYFHPVPVKKKKKQLPGRVEEEILYDYEKELDEKKMRQMYNPNDSMIQLDIEKELKNQKFICTIKDNIVWFLQEGPKGTDLFFSNHLQKQYIHQTLKIKIKSLKVYLGMISALIEEDHIDPKFIANVKFIC